MDVYFYTLPAAGIQDEFLATSFWGKGGGAGTEEIARRDAEEERDEG
jgi:hypothetical protein